MVAGVGEGRLRPPRRADRKLSADVKAFAAKLAVNDQFSGAILLARHGQPLLRRAYGMADRAQEYDQHARNAIHALVDRQDVHRRRHGGARSEDATILPDTPLGSVLRSIRWRRRASGDCARSADDDSGIQDLFRVPAFWSEIATVKSPTDLAVLRVDAAAIPARHSMGLRNSNFSSAWHDHRAPCVPRSRQSSGKIFRRLKLTNTHYSIDAARPAALGYADGRFGSRRSRRDWLVSGVEGTKARRRVHRRQPDGRRLLDRRRSRALRRCAHQPSLLSKAMTDRVLTGSIDAGYGGARWMWF